ncbi:hypothetical protein SLEP1_g34219 [Rubroshorea leprosula]|uniref:Secreted protein n=1 Tax=Rubroshorea leprosula TaxID=152421 RepID=A0AAV5KJ86_9ROSI|nr:hypothetical protein SLEP1_g34219 [Rubroshorea leprosula]
MKLSLGSSDSIVLVLVSFSIAASQLGDKKWVTSHSYSSSTTTKQRTKYVRVKVYTVQAAA